MSLNIIRLYGDDDGETHFDTIEIPTEANPAAPGVTSVDIPTTRISFVEYSADRSDPGFHATPPHLVINLRGGFEVTTSTGESKVIEPGDWFLADDLGSKGHMTKAVGNEGRVNLAIGLAPDWKFPGT